MQTPPKPTTLLLVIIAALLAANLFVSTDREAKAQTHLKAVRAPHVIQVETPEYGRVFRLWSDGVIEEAVPIEAAGEIEAAEIGMRWRLCRKMSKERADTTRWQGRFRGDAG